MPSNVTFDSHQRAQLANRLRRAQDATRTHARRAAEARRSSRQAEEQKNQLVAVNSSLANMDIHRKTEYLLLLLGVVAVYLIDVILFAPIAEYFASKSFAGSPWLASAARFLLPASIIALELTSSIYRQVAYRDDLDGFATRKQYWGWTLFGACFTLVMPMAVLAIFMAGEGEEFTPWISIPLLITLVGLSLAGHILMLFGGRLAMESKSWVIFQAQLTTLQGRLRQSGQKHTRHSQIAADRFTAYLQDLNDYNTAYPNARIEAAFDRETRDVVNDVYGYEVIRTPGAPGKPTQADQQVALPENPPQNLCEPQTNDWRNDYERRMREQETEVRP